MCCGFRRNGRRLLGRKYSLHGARGRRWPQLRRQRAGLRQHVHRARA
jgi:hypothetical protein